MLLSFEILQSLKGRRSLAMRKATSQQTLSETAVALTESEGQSCFTMTSQSTGESLWFPAKQITAACRYDVQRW